MKNKKSAKVKQDKVKQRLKRVKQKVFNMHMVYTHRRTQWD